MHAIDRPPLTVTTHDARRLEALLQGPTGLASSIAPLLEEELLRARLVEPAQISPDIVTMNSHVVCVDEITGEEQRLQLVYPQHADAGLHRVSVLAPVGAALLGLAVGGSIAWPIPGGRSTRVRVKAVPYQPEAAGRLD